MCSCCFGVVVFQFCAIHFSRAYHGRMRSNKNNHTVVNGLLKEVITVYKEATDNAGRQATQNQEGIGERENRIPKGKQQRVKKRRWRTSTTMMTTGRMRSEPTKRAQNNNNSLARSGKQHVILFLFLPTHFIASYS